MPDSRRPTKRTPTARPTTRPATGDAAPARASGANRPGSDVVVRRGIIAGIVVAALLLVALVGYLVLSYTPVFSIENVETVATKHMSKASIAKLAKIPKGSTLLNLDEAKVTENLEKNPWVGSVSYQKEFPNTLRIVVTERKVSALVVMSAGDVVWYLGEDNVWIQPASIKVGESDSVNDVALKAARKAGTMLITDVPASITPMAGSASSAEVLKAVSSYREQFSTAFAKQIVSFSASSLESISCTLKSGVVVSLGSPTNIASKEAVITQIISKYSGKLTYINVRVPSSPAYRLVDSKYAVAGTGVTGTDLASANDDSSSSSSSDTSDSSSSDTGTSSADTSGTSSTSSSTSTGTTDSTSTTGTTGTSGN